MFRTLLLLFLFFPVFLQAQSPEKKQRWGISFTPAIVSSPFLQYGIQPGAEYRINKNIFLLTEITFSTFSRHIDSSVLDRKYFRIKPELRYVLPEGMIHVEKYLAAQFSYTFRSFKNEHDGYYFDRKRNPDTMITAFDRAKITSPIITASIQLGVDFSVSKNFFVAMFVGAGIRIIDTKYRDVVNPRSELYFHPLDKAIPAPDAAYLYQGNVYRPHFNAGLRLLYRFRRN